MAQACSGTRGPPVDVQSRQSRQTLSDAGLVILLGITLGDSVELAKRLAAKALTPACIKPKLPLSGQPKPSRKLAHQALRSRLGSGKL